MIGNSCRVIALLWPRLILTFYMHVQIVASDRSSRSRVWTCPSIDEYRGEYALSRVCACVIQVSRGNTLPLGIVPFCHAECNSTYFLFTRHSVHEEEPASPGFARSVGVIQLISRNSGLAVPTYPTASTRKHSFLCYSRCALLS